MPSDHASSGPKTSTRHQTTISADEAANRIQWPVSLAHVRPQLESLANVWSQPNGAAWLLHEDGTILPLTTENGDDSNTTNQTELEHIRCPLNGQWSIVVGGVSKNEGPRFRNAVELLSRFARNQTELEATVAAAIEATDELVALQQLVAIQIDALDDTTLTEYIARSTNAMTKAAAVVLIDEKGRQTTSGTPSAVETLVSFLGDAPKPQIQRADDSGAPFDYVVKRLAGDLATIAIAGLPGVRITTPQLRHLDSVSGHATGLLRLAKQQQHMVERAVIDRDAEAAALMAAQVLPDRLPVLDGYQVAARCEPARMAAGDFYQFIQTNDRLVAVIGDVSGKGLAAAMVMGMVASHAHRSALELPDADAADLLEAINDATYAYLTKVGRFVTLAVIVCSASDGAVSVCNAGHSPLLLATKNQDVYDIASIPADAPPLGVLETLDASANTLTLSAGDRLVAGTDGLAEQEDSDGQQYGYPEFERLVATADGGNAEQLVDHLFATVEAFADGNPPDDDRTAFIVQRQAP